MQTINDVRAGDIMFARHVSPKAVDLLILAGQWSLGQPGYPHHVGVVTQATTAGLVPLNGTAISVPPVPARMVQAMPSGTEEVDLDATFWTGDYEFIRPNYRSEYTAPAVARAARRYIKTPYSFLDYLAIEGARLGVRNGPIRNYVTTSRHMICSQLADQSLTDAGFHVFTDDRLPQDVTPSALRARLIELGPVAVIRPGQ